MNHETISFDDISKDALPPSWGVRPRLIPSLLMVGSGLVKTERFNKRTYLGDPINVVRIFNEKMVDELVLLDIEATPKGREPDYNQIADIVSEAFMPIAYGGGIADLQVAKRILSIGVEKLVVNSAAVKRPDLIHELSAEFGTQSVIIAVDVKLNWMGGNRVVTHSAAKKHKLKLVEWVAEAVRLGAGEVLLNSVDRDGTMAGYDVALIEEVSKVVSCPLIACGGASDLASIKLALQAGATDVAAGSMFVFHGPRRAVLITYPDRNAIRSALC